MRTILMVFAAAGLLAPLPALAEELDWAAASATYQAGRANPYQGMKYRDEAYCAAYWASWVDTINDGRLTTQVQAKLDKDLTAPDARLYTLAWLLWIGDDDAVMEYYDKQKVTAKEMLDTAFDGEQLSLTAMANILGRCQMPEDE